MKMNACWIRKAVCALLAPLLLCPPTLAARAADSTGGSWAQINTLQERPEGWRQIVQDSAFRLGERREAGEANGKPIYEADYGTYPSIDGSTVAVPMALEFARQHLGLSDDDARGFVYFSTTHGAYEHLIRRQPNGSPALPSLATAMDPRRPVDLVITTEPSDAELALASASGVTLVQKPVCLDAFVFITSVDNPVDELSLEEIRRIYSGKYTDWSDIYSGDEDANGEIDAYQREPNSGSQTAMENMVMQGTPIAGAQQIGIAYAMSDLTSRVGEYENGTYSLGYTFKYYLDALQQNDRIKILKINGVAPTDETMRDRSYPLTVSYYGVIRAGDEAEPGGRFLDWMLSDEGQACVAQAGYVPMSALSTKGKYVEWEGFADVPSYQSKNFYSWDGVIYRMYEDRAEFVGFSDDKVAVLHEVVDGRPMTSEVIRGGFLDRLEEVTLCRGVRSVCFSDSYALRKVNFSDTVTTLEDGCFWFTKVQEVTLPQSLTTIEPYAFSGSSVREVIIPEGVTRIEERTFEDAWSLERVVLPSRLISIGDYAFQESSLKRIDIPASVGSIATSAFYRCNDLEAIHVDPANEAYYSEDGLLFSREGSTLLRFPPAKCDFYDVPPGTEHIASSAFRSGDGLRSLTLPLGVKELKEETFSECTSLERITLPMTLTRIGASAFEDCVSLAEIAIPEGVTEIEKHTFFNCAKLRSVRLPSTLERIDEYAFRYCPSLRELRIPASVTDIDSDAFGNDSREGETQITLIVTEGSYAEQYAQRHGIPYRAE